MVPNKQSISPNMVKIVIAIIGLGGTICVAIATVVAAIIPTISRTNETQLTQVAEAIPPIITTARETQPTEMQTPQSNLVENTPLNNTSATETPKPTEKPTETPLPTPSEKMLYEADWSTGLNGWNGSPDWKTVSGMLVNDGTGNFPSSGIITPPFNASDISDFAIETEMQVFRPPETCAVHFGIIVRARQPEGRLTGYMLGRRNTFCSVPSDGDILIALYEGPNKAWDVGALAELELQGDSKWHKYRFEIQGNIFRVYLDGVLAVEAVDNRFLDGGSLLMYSAPSTVLNVRSFKILELPSP